MLPELERLRDMARAGRKLRLPLVNREIPLVADEWAKPEMGSGCVKITPAHDPNDYEVGLRQKLPMINIFNPDGTLNANAGPYQGLTVADGPRARRGRSGSAGPRWRRSRIARSSWPIPTARRRRSSRYLADQWFVRMERPGAIGHGRRDRRPREDLSRSATPSGYLDWLGEKRDWPVSRQLWWGHQIPIWYAPERQRKPSLQARLRRPRRCRLAARRGARGVGLICALEEDLAEDSDPRPRSSCAIPTCSIPGSARRCGRIRRSAGPSKTPELDYYYPTSVLVTSRDIITLWVARMVLTGLYNVGDVPFHEVFIHPKILDGYGETMSKSKGNGVDPLDIIDKFGADALRFGLAYLTTETQDVRMPVEFECPHCQNADRADKEEPRAAARDVQTVRPGFSTQWAEQAGRRGPAARGRGERAL